jgi:hypothetical protein
MSVDGYNRYLFEYQYEGSEWGLEIIARSPEEAEKRLAALAWAKYKGEIAVRIPVPGLLKRMATFFLR